MNATLAVKKGKPEKKKKKKSPCLNGNRICGLYDTGAVFYQLSSQVNWEVVILFVMHSYIEDGHV